jgi:glycosyltransferase involved in cell wall biosynthesis
MKVLYICNSDLGKHGNIGFRTYHVAKEAYRRGYLKKIICRGSAAKDLPQEKIEKVNFWYRPFNLMLSGISQYLIKKFPARNIQLNLFDWLVARKLRKKRIKADVLHIYEYATKVIREAKKQGMKVVLDTQMAHGKKGAEIFNLNRKHFIETKSSQMADKIVASSDFVVQSYVEAGVPREKLARIPHGVDLKRFNVKKKDNGKFTCLFIGIVEKRKGLQYLLRAWKALKLDNAELIIGGIINKDGKPLAQKYKKYKNIKFPGFVNPVPYYEIADVFVFPSMFESSAKVLYEAMAAGLPIVTTFNAGPIFKDREAGFVVPIRDPRALAEKISYLYKNRAEAQRMGKKAKEIVQARSWNNYGKELIDLYSTFS